MKILAFASDESADALQVTIKATMPLWQWKLVKESLQRSQNGPSWNATTSKFLSALTDTVSTYETTVFNEIDLGDEK